MAHSLYVDIYNKILEQIITGEYPENFSLPSERYLCEKYHVSRSTIRNALAALKKDGYIYTIHGNGNFIKPQLYEQPLGHFYSFTDELKNSQVLIENRIISCELCCLDTELCGKLGVPEDEKFHKLIRLRSAQSYPLMIETTYLPRSRFYKLDMDSLNSGSLYEYLNKQYNLTIERALEMFHPVMPSAKEANLLRISQGIPCTSLERFSYEDNALVEYTVSTIRGDKYMFKVELSKN